MVDIGLIRVWEFSFLKIHDMMKESLRRLIIILCSYFLMFIPSFGLHVIMIWVSLRKNPR
jgi:hypothetical protein